jgi:hypothetical protein
MLLKPTGQTLMVAGAAIGTVQSGYYLKLPEFAAKRYALVSSVVTYLLAGGPAWADEYRRIFELFERYLPNGTSNR